jgi:hypothetical protein
MKKVVHKKAWWVPVTHFLGHVVAGSLIFTIILVAAIGLAGLVTWAKGLGFVDPFVIGALVWLEHAIVVADVTLVSIFLLVAFGKSVKEAIGK